LNLEDDCEENLFLRYLRGTLKGQGWQWQWLLLLLLSVRVNLLLPPTPWLEDSAATGDSEVICLEVDLRSWNIQSSYECLLKNNLFNGNPQLLHAKKVGGCSVGGPGSDKSCGELQWSWFNSWHPKLIFCHRTSFPHPA
jgi:hypothetical protein